MVYQYMVKVYKFLVKQGSRTIESLPLAYQSVVAEELAREVE